MGGGGGGGGGPLAASFAWSVWAGATGVGISACDMKILRPLPSYLVSSLAFSQSNRKLGSRERGAVAPLRVGCLPRVTRRARTVGDAGSDEGIPAAGAGVGTGPELNRARA